MCLMCEHYLDICDKPECVSAAKARYEATKATPKPSISLMEEYFRSRSGAEYFLWKGYSEAPCKHIVEDHGPECNVVKRVETEYGLLFDTCNCDPDTEAGWVYY